MGYDMYAIEKDEAEELAYQAQMAVFTAACNERDAYLKRTGQRLMFSATDFDKPANEDPEINRLQDAVNAALGEADSIRKSYFRLNIWGMGEYRQAMLALDMAYEADNSLTWPEVDESTYDDETGEYANQDQINRVLEEHPGEAVGIPLFKLSDNSGWRVMPAECRGALMQWENNSAYILEQADPESTVGKVIRSEYWQEWLAYLASSAERGGFAVH